MAKDIDVLGKVCCSPLNDNNYFQIKEELCLVSFNLKLDPYYLNNFFYFLLGPNLIIVPIINTISLELIY
ncbi:hypothetical protein BpHYR1_039000 [Brachionus plicatilis]|uniref:Uncharacterized protein n=1 Tax=Brachionus plicatilis TaxID=10195 RepID=A0A3M7QJF3_BRAPC|nr:hypothetical protein BpHYR1_039000 [Brachionus plicatilis]